MVYERSETRASHFFRSHIIRQNTVAGLLQSNDFAFSTLDSEKVMTGIVVFFHCPNERSVHVINNVGGHVANHRTKPAHLIDSGITRMIGSEIVEEISARTTRVQEDVRREKYIFTSTGSYTTE